MTRAYKHSNNKNKSYEELLVEAEYQTRIEANSAAYIPTEEEILQQCEKIRSSSERTNIKRGLIKNPFKHDRYNISNLIPTINMREIGLDNGLNPMDFC